MITKKDIPFDLLKVVEPLAQANLDIIQLKKEDNTYYFFEETDSNSKLYFKIYIDGSKIIGNYDSRRITIEYKPINSSSTAINYSQSTSVGIEDEFRKWLQLIRSINETPSIHDDNFVKQYAEFYFNEFKIVDIDANTNPFNPDQQDMIEIYLTSLSKAIEQSGNNLPENSKNELIDEIQAIQSSLPITTKNQVMRGITKVFAKLYKASKNLAKEITTEAKKQLVKKLIELGIEYGPKFIELVCK